MAGYILLTLTGALLALVTLPLLLLPLTMLGMGMVIFGVFGIVIKRQERK